MFAWFKALPLASKLLTGGIALALGLALIYAVFDYLRDSENAENQNYINQGVTQERDASKSEVINSVQNANDARNRPDPALERRVCEKYDRNCPHNQ